MTAAETYLAQADDLVSSDLSEAHLDVQSLAATFKARRKAKDPKAAIFARALVKRAVGTGLEVKAAKPSTIPELKAEIERRNEGREEADLIVPEGTRKADLEAALAADDARA